MAGCLTVCALLILATVAGCGGGERMTVGEYAVACGALLKTFDGPFAEDESGFLFVEGVTWKWRTGRNQMNSRRCTRPC